MIGTGLMLRHILRRDRWILTSWVALLVLMTVGQAARYAEAFPTPESVADFATQMADNRALLAFAGHIYSPTLGGLTVWRIGDTIYTLIGLMALLTVIRHTRTEEETGRAELIGSGVVGRFAPLAAAALVSASTSLLIGLFTAAGLGSDPGAIAFGIGITAAGLVFTAIAALAAQITTGARTAIAIGVSILAIGYGLRFAADAAGTEWLKWLTPQGWSHLIAPYAANTFTPVAIALTVTAVLFIAAFVLRSRRDLGLGLIPQRLGPAHDPGLTGVLALAWRMQRGLLTGWIAGFAIAGAFFGMLARSIPDLAATGDAVGEFLRRYTAGPDAEMTDAYLWLIALSLGYTAALYPMLAMLRVRSEESSGTAELLLSTPVSRLRHISSHLVISAVGTVALLAAAGLTMGVAAGDPVRVLGGMLLQIPAVWLIGSVSVLAVGLLPRPATAIAWATFLFVNLFGEVLGPIMKLDYWIANLVVPFHHLPKVLSGEAFRLTPVAVMTLLAAALAFAGLIGYRRRDLA